MEEGIRARLERKRAAHRRKSLRWFGVGLGLILAWVAKKALGADHAAGAAAAASAGLACFLLGLAKPSALEPVYKPWMKAAGFLARVNTALVMGLLYYLMITPYAFLGRLFGAAMLDEVPAGSDSYWKPRGEPPTRESYRAQF